MQVAVAIIGRVAVRPVDAVLVYYNFFQVSESNFNKIFKAKKFLSLNVCYYSCFLKNFVYNFVSSYFVKQNYN